MKYRKSATKSDGLLVDEIVEVGGAANPDARRLAWPIPSDDVQTWFEVRVADHQVVVGFADAETIAAANDGTAAHAITWAEVGLVAIDRALKRDRAQLAVILLHELVHVGLGAAFGNETLVRSILGARTATQHTDREENLAAYLSSMLAKPLVDAKLLRLPKVPR